MIVTHVVLLGCVFKAWKCDTFIYKTESQLVSKKNPKKCILHFFLSFSLIKIIFDISRFESFSPKKTNKSAWWPIEFSLMSYRHQHPPPPNTKLISLPCPLQLGHVMIKRETSTDPPSFVKIIPAWHSASLLSLFPPTASLWESRHPSPWCFFNQPPSLSPHLPDRYNIGSSSLSGYIYYEQHRVFSLRLYLLRFVTSLGLETFSTWRCDFNWAWTNFEFMLIVSERAC